jgi:hypothetical protein
MRTRALIGLLGALMMVASLAHADGLSHELLEGLRLIPVGTAPPALALKRLDDGRTLTLTDLRGRPVLLYFWATW